MAFLRCFWMKRRLAPYLDGALSGERAEAVAAHLRGAAECRGEVARLERVRGLLRSTFTVGPDPDWTRFWDGVRGRIVGERPRPWGEVWGGSPPLALGGACAGPAPPGAAPVADRGADRRASPARRRRGQHGGDRPSGRQPDGLLES